MVGVKLMVGVAALPTNPEKGHNGKCRTKDAEHPRDASTGENKSMISWSQMDLEYVCKIIIEIN